MRCHLAAAAGQGWCKDQHTRMPAVVPARPCFPAGTALQSQWNTYKELGSLGMPCAWGPRCTLQCLCRILEDAVRSLILSNGITVVVASGNSDVNACTVAPACVQVSRSAQLQPPMPVAAPARRSKLSAAVHKRAVQAPRSPAACAVSCCTAVSSQLRSVQAAMTAQVHHIALLIAA